MIKIHDELWFIKKREKEYDPETNDYRDEITLSDLSYMTYYENNKQFESRCSTGCNWASGRGVDKLVFNDGKCTNNTPMTGFKVVESVSRWSTSNKLFRIQDPRGFIVEIPSGNLATLLLDTTVIKGVIQGECVWGREGSNHVLLPLNSQPYLDTLKTMDVLENKLLKPKDLVVGDWVNLFNPTYRTDKVYFAGRGKITWKNMRTKEEVVDGWQWFFIAFYKDGTVSNIINSPSLKITEVIEHKEIDWYSMVSDWGDRMRDYPSHRIGDVPDRILNKFKVVTDFNPSYRYGHTADPIKMINIEYK